MNHANKLNEILEEKGGYLQTADVVREGISKPYLASYVVKNHLKKVGHGIYVTEDTWVDELYILGLRNQKAYFSHETALHLHGLMEREPFETTMTVKVGYNATHLREEGVRVFQVQSEIFNLGLEKKETFFGNEVKVYNKERTICDIIKNKKDMDIQIFQVALREYVQSKDKNLTRLMDYAEKLKVLEEVEIYIEVLL